MPHDEETEIVFANEGETQTPEDTNAIAAEVETEGMQTVASEQHPMRWQTPVAGQGPQGEIKDPNARYITYLKPDGFDERETCDAPIDAAAGVYCKEPREGCPKHCGAWSRQSGRACAAGPKKGNGRRCRMHGTMKCGAANGNYKSGQYSSLRPPKNLRKAFDRAMADAEELSPKASAALMHARSVELLDQLTERISKKWVADLRASWEAHKKAQHDKDIEAIGETAKLHDKIVTEGARYDDQWAEIEKALERRDKHAKLEWQRQVDTNQMMHISSVMVIIHQVQDSINKRVKDRSTLIEIQQDLATITGGNGPGSDRFDDEEDEKE